MTWPRRTSKLLCDSEDHSRRDLGGAAVLDAQGGSGAVAGSNQLGSTSLESLGQSDGVARES